MRVAGGISFFQDVGNHDEGTGPDRGLDGVGIRHRDDGVRCHDPERLDATVCHRPKEIDGLEPRLFGNLWRTPEALDAIAITGIFDRHVCCEHVRKPADLAAAHRIRLPRQRERPHARPADAAGRKVTVEDRVDLVGARRRLVDALAVAGHDLLGCRKQPVEFAQLHRRKTGPLEHVVERNTARCEQGITEAGRMRRDIVLVDGIAGNQM